MEELLCFYFITVMYFLILMKMLSSSAVNFCMQNLDCQLFKGTHANH